MYSFRNDYSEGAHPQVLQALTDTNLVQTCGYGVDPICEEARDLIRTVCAAPTGRCFSFCKTCAFWRPACFARRAKSCSNRRGAPTARCC